MLGVATPPEASSHAGGWQQQRRATSRSASRCQEGACMSTATTTAACTRARAARALYTLQQGPRSTKRAPSTAIEFQRARLRVGKTAFTSTTMWRMFAARTGGPRALARSRRRARAAATSRVTGPVLAASSTSEMHCRSQWSRSGLSECIHVAVVGHHLMPVEACLPLLALRHVRDPRVHRCRHGEPTPRPPASRRRARLA